MDEESVAERQSGSSGGARQQRGGRKDWPARGGVAPTSQRGDLRRCPLRLLIMTSCPGGQAGLRDHIQIAQPVDTQVSTGCAHVAFEVDDLPGALEWQHVIIEPNSPSRGVRVACSTTSSPQAVEATLSTAEGQHAGLDAASLADLRAALSKFRDATSRE